MPEGEPLLCLVSNMRLYEVWPAHGEALGCQTGAQRLTVREQGKAFAVPGKEHAAV